MFQIQVEAIEAFEAGDEMIKFLSKDDQHYKLIPNNLLHFPIGARITVLQKNAASSSIGISKNTWNTTSTDNNDEASTMWLGRYNNTVWPY